MNLNAIDGAALLILGALLLTGFYTLRATPRARRATPIVTNQRHDCFVTVCRYAAHIPVTIDGETRYGCGGHWAEGLKRGWFQ